MRVSTLSAPLVRRLAIVKPTFALIEEIEDEIAPLPVLARRLKLNVWSASEVVSLVQMVLQAAGETRDWRALADKMTREGFENYIQPLRGVLDSALKGYNKE